MLNKRIKSLLVAGLVILGMSGNAFALETTVISGNDNASSNPENFCGHTGSKLNTGEPGEHILDGKIKIVISDDGKYASVTSLKEKIKVLEDGKEVEKEFDMVKIKYVHVKGADAYNCYTFAENENGGSNFSSPLKNGKIPGISHITVVYEVIDNSKKSNIPETPITPDVPTTPTTQEPVTGDASIMPIVATAAISAVGLLVLNKKDDEE